MLISEISRQILERYDVRIRPQELNAMLKKTGDLVETAIGKVETVQGRAHGICGEYRKHFNDPPYWCPHYNEEARNYVIDCTREVFANRFPMESAFEPERAFHTAAERTEHEERLLSLTPQIPVRTAVASCQNCIYLRNETCGMPKAQPCTDYSPAYTPNEEDIMIRRDAAANSWVSSRFDQNALGGEREYSGFD